MEGRDVTTPAGRAVAVARRQCFSRGGRDGEGGQTGQSRLHGFSPAQASLSEPQSPALRPAAPSRRPSTSPPGRRAGSSLCRSITRLALSEERLQLNAAGQVELKLKSPWRDGTTNLVISPLEFMQRLAALVPRPRLHLIRFHGVPASNAKLRPLVVRQGPPAQAQEASEGAATAECEVETVQAGPCRIGLARLLKRVFDIDMRHSSNCGAGELKIIAAILERPVIEKILTHLELDPQPPPKGRAREAGHD